MILKKNLKKKNHEQLETGINAWSFPYKHHLYISCSDFISFRIQFLQVGKGSKPIFY